MSMSRRGVRQVSSGPRGAKQFVDAWITPRVPRATAKQGVELVPDDSPAGEDEFYHLPFVEIWEVGVGTDLFSGVALFEVVEELRMRKDSLNG